MTSPDFPTRGAMFHLLAGIIMLVLIIVVYVVLFALHFIIANHTGPGIAWHVGDTKYMQTIIGTPEYEEMDPAFVHQQPSVLDKVWYIHKVMFDANRGITVDHPWSSKWYSWPFDVKGLMFWVQNNHMVYQLGNPFVWWGSTLMILLSILYSIHNTPFYTDPPQVLTSRKKMNQYQARLPYIERAKYEVAWLLFGYFCNLLPYVGVTRACWLYHYVPALFFGELAGCLWLDQLLRRSGNVRRFTTISVSVVLCVYGWWRFRAFTYAMHYTDDELDEMRWLSTWN
ncbi:hypothetical protein SARC_04130 [Sphaeroforma arctica JP610]|uniref:Protein O-mannosyl-transferase C-terminal four TM domain-containing protein n=1 Tax=Sphaeroforma arctica JP610 TaxID=667725 RepID=A0A0L0G495_9EUKA|nr:hypothetical protein SARC_04130 [Sphaeroforma arctica JP610]KNC83631.1 hypothetical protein SARC_04130 [Sphaeroforma arctica JP610]|eukprot:XP_014157533.1 hypothetical protein SARC_04130 [Sphaeroforma arctica JP610]